jgi:uncharacterized phage protein (TIGR02218 family)
MKSNQNGNQVTNYATVWTIACKGGHVLGFADCDGDIMFGGVLCRAAQSFTARSFINSCDINSTPLVIEGFIDGIYIKNEDIVCGRLDSAVVEVAIVDYLQPQKFQILKRGYIANIVTQGDKFSAEVLGAEGYLHAIITQSYSDRCRAHFCDERCGLV